MPAKVLIVHPPTMGLRHDRLVLAEALRRCDPEIHVSVLEVAVAGHHDYETPLDVQSLSELKPFDCVFLLEEARSNPPLFDRGFAKKAVFVPNVDWLLPIDERSLVDYPVDVILLKNAYARQRMAATRLCIHLPKAYVVGWSSVDPGDEAASAWPLGRSFLHVAGTSRQKGTSLLLGAWLDAPSWPTLTVAQSLLPDPTAFQTRLDLRPNVALHLSTLPDRPMRRLQAAHGLHIYPSQMEGFGHALNEVRALGRVLVTTNAPPMRDLVEDGVTGSLIAADPATEDPFSLSLAYPVTRQAVQAAVASVLDRDPAALAAMGHRARRAYLRDKDFFHRDLGRVWREIRP